jgi:hypothetical protein
MSEIDFTGVGPSLARRTNRFCRTGLAVAWLVLTAAGAIAADTTTNATRQPQPARWLLVVDTSASMAQRAQALEGVLGELLLSGIDGQIKAGDQLGIWTYNQELSAGIAPMQNWIPARSNIIAGRSSRFIGRQKYENQPHIEKVIPELNRIMKESRQLTVLIFSDGAQDIVGTPFDAAINAAYAKQRSDLARTRMPLVTVLRAERGKFIGQNVSFAPWPIEFPPFPPEPKPIETPKPAMKSIVISGGPKETVPATNSFTVSTTPNATTNVPVAEVKPVPLVPVEPAPIVEPVVPAPLLETNSTSAAKPVEMGRVEVPQPMPDEPAPSEVEQPVPAPVAVAPAPVSASEPGRTGALSTQKWLIILGMGCMWVAIVIALVLVRRSRHAHAASLITRSFDRNQQ